MADFSRLVIGKAPRGQNEFMTEIKALLETTKAALDKEQSALSFAKEETASFANEVRGLKDKINNVEASGANRAPAPASAPASAPLMNLMNELPPKEIMPSGNVPGVDGMPLAVYYAAQIPLSLGSTPAQIPLSANYPGATMGKYPLAPLNASSTNQIITGAALQSLRAELRTKDETLSTLVRTNAALSKQLEELRSGNREQERAYFELLKLVDGVTSALTGELVPLTKATAFYIEDRHRGLVQEIKGQQDKILSMKDINIALVKELDEAKAAAKRFEAELNGFRHRVSLAESQSQMLLSDRNRAGSEVAELQEEIARLQGENLALKDQYALEVQAVKDEFKRKLKATVWNQAGKAAGGPAGGEDAVQLVVWLDESATVESDVARLRDAAGGRDFSIMLAILSSYNDKATHAVGVAEVAASLVGEMAVQPELQADIMACGLLDAILVAMRQRIDSVGLQEQAARLLNVLGSVEQYKAPIAASAVVDLLLTVRMHMDDARMQAECLNTLCTLCTPASAREIAEYGLDDVLRSMRRHAGSDEVLRPAYEILHLLTGDDANSHAIGERCLIEVVDSMRQQPGNEALQESACSVLCNLARDDNNRQAIMELGLGDVLAAMRSHKQSPGVQEKACAALGNLAAADANTAVIAEESLPDILEAMSQHMDRPGVIAYACTALWYLSTNPSQLARIAEFGLDILMAAITTHLDRPDVLAQACGAALNLSRDPAGCALMLQAGCDNIMNDVLDRHAGVPEVDQLASRVLAQLTREGG